MKVSQEHSSGFETDGECKESGGCLLDCTVRSDSVDIRRREENTGKLAPQWSPIITYTTRSTRSILPPIVYSRSPP